MIPTAPPAWLPHEKPMLPGSPSTPLHSWNKRAAYAVVGTLVGITGGLSNALVTANLQNLQGALGAYAAEVAWLPAAYVMTNVSMNLLLVKFRQEFGLRLFTEAFLVLYALVALAHLFVNDLASAIAVRAAHGMVGAALSSLGIYYTMQAFSAAHRSKGLALGLGLSTLALPLARVLPASLLEFAEWRGLYLFELGLTLVTLGAVLLLSLPPGDRVKTFEKMDFVTFMLFAPGMALLCAVLSLGRMLWWFDTPWLGWALAGSIALLTGAMAIEHNRRNPLLDTRWLGSGSMVQLALVMILLRVVVSEQSTGSVGFLQALNLGTDQLRSLYVVVLAGSVLGLATSAISLRPPHFTPPIVVALVMMIAGALMDSQATSLTRPSNMMVSQFLLGFGGGLFLAPALLSVVGAVVAVPSRLVSFSVIFGITQNLGGLIGSALLGSVQTWREKFHSNLLAEHLTLLDPQVAARLAQGTSAYARAVTDPTLRSAQGSAALAAATAREAGVLAYNDVFLMIAGIASFTLVIVLAHAVWLQFNPPPEAPAAPPPAVANPGVPLTDTSLNPS